MNLSIPTPSLPEIFRMQLEKALQRLPQNEAKKVEIEVMPCAKEQFGHYQSNLALKLAKILQKPPMEIAEMLEKLLDKGEEIAHVSVTKPGFMNATFAKEALSKRVHALLEDPLLCAARPKSPQRIIVEFSSPNIAKELHVGHLRSTIIGESIARLLAFLGHDILRLNHVGDWGTQFGMLIAYIDKYAAFDTEKSPNLETLMHWYKEAKKQFDADPSFRTSSQQAVVSLQQGDARSLNLWKAICAISRTAFEEIYQLLDVHIEERGESFYNPQLAPMVKELEEQGMIEISDGAKCIFLDGFTNREGNRMPFMVQKSDGGFNYDTTDLAALKHRVLVEKADRIIIVTDLGQSLHFQLLFAAGKQVGYYDPSKVQVDHVGFGLVLGEDGKKFKTRSGETKKLVDLLKNAVVFAQKLVDEKSPDLSQSQRESLAKSLGISAVKYADLASHRQKDYTFSYARMLRFEGNTAVFLLYSYVRMLGIQRKVQAKKTPPLSVTLTHQTEISLGLHLLRFSEALAFAEKELHMHYLCDYLYHLAEKFNAFFRDCRVEGAKEEQQRLLLVEACRKVLQKGLYILGIPTVDRM